MNPMDFKVAQLKEVLQRKGLTTTGAKVDLIKRLQEDDPSGSWMNNMQRGTESELIDIGNHEEDYQLPIETEPENAVSEANRWTAEELRREVNFMRRERELLQRELRLAERENEQLRRSNASGDALEVQPKVNVRSVGDLLSDFDGTEGTFRNWERQLQMLIATYQLDQGMSRILIAMRLKGRALSWFHSRPEYVQVTIAELLAEMKKMFDQRENKLKLRRQFEERVWKADEPFSVYLHEKIILGNRVSIDEEDVVDYLIDGIPEVHLQNQAKIQQFESSAALLAAFENISLTGGKGRGNREAGEGVKPTKGPAKLTSTGAATKEATPTAVTTKEATPMAATAKEANPAAISPRCYNCSKFGHIAKYCKLPRREKGACFKCGEKGHTANDCKGKGASQQISCVGGKSENEFKKYVTFGINELGLKSELTLDTLIDTGSPISLIKEKFVPNCIIARDDLSDGSFCGLNGSKLVKVGTIVVNLQYDGISRSGVRMYVVADGTMSAPAIIGRDVLKLCNVTLTAPSADDQKIVCEDILSIDISEPADQVQESLVINPKIPYEEQTELQNLFETEYVQPERPDEPKVDMELKLTVDKIVPFHAAPRRLSYAEKNRLQEILDVLLAKGIIRKSTSDCVSAIVIVSKKNGEKRLCVDFRFLNKYLARDNYPIPLIEDQLNILYKKKYFSVLDLKDGFYHIRMAEDSIKYTSFVTPLGQFEFIKMPFGLKPAPTRFQRFVNEVLDELIRSGDVVVYIDDFLVATETIEHHLKILKRVFRLLVENKLTLRIDKCKFLFEKIEYLGYSISAEGISPTETGIDAVLRFPVPESVRHVQSFLGLCSYFRKFIEKFAIIAKPLYDLLRKSKDFKFTEIELDAFEKLKQTLITAPILAIYSPNDVTELHCDASALGFGAVLMQKKSDLKWHPIFYFSKRTTETESKYHSFELETLAIVYALKRFRVYLQGISFKIITDCNSLKLTLAKKDINPRIARWALELQTYDYVVEHRSGERMKHVDALSRSFGVYIVEDNPFEYNLAMCQSQDAKIKDLADKLEKTEDKFFEMRNSIVFRKKGDALLFYVPENMVNNVLFRYHDQMGHLGVEKTTNAISRNYWFPGLKQKVDTHIKNCLKCISFSPSAGKAEGVLHAIPKGEVPWHTLHIDHYGPIDPKCLVKKYIFLVVDAFTKYVKLYSTKTTASKEAIACLSDYFACYSRPMVIVSDRGTCFTSHEFSEYLKEEDIKHILIATGSPQANGQVERVNRVLGPMLGKITDHREGKKWYKFLREIEYALNNTTNKSTGETPSRLLFGIDQRGDVNDMVKEYLDVCVNSKKASLTDLRCKASENIKASQISNAKYFNAKRKMPLKYQEGDFVMLRNFDNTPGTSKKLIPQFKGPYTVTKSLRNDRYLVADVDGFQNTQKLYQGVWEAKNMRPWKAEF